MEILTREGKSSWFPSGIYFSQVNRCFSFFFFFPAFLLRTNMDFLFAPCFDHFLSDSSSGSAITSRQWAWEGTKDETGLPEREKWSTHPGTLPAQPDDMWPGAAKESVPWTPRWENDGVPPSMGNEWGSAQRLEVQPKKTNSNSAVKDSPKHLRHHPGCSPTEDV